MYEGQSKSSRPDLVLFRIIKLYLLLIVASLRTRHVAAASVWNSMPRQYVQRRHYQSSAEDWRLNLLSGLTAVAPHERLTVLTTMWPHITVTCPCSHRTCAALTKFVIIIIITVFRVRRQTSHHYCVPHFSPGKLPVVPQFISRFLPVSTPASRSSAFYQHLIKSAVDRRLGSSSIVE